MTYYAPLKTEENARYKSWEHCHRYFLENRHNPDAKDFMCLHLAFFLASWGMLRGGAFLLQKDYLVHLPVVEIILDEQFEPLWDCSAEDLLDDSIVGLILGCKELIVEAYRKKTIQIGDEVDKGRNASDTLVTKIFLGTFGCTPAFDRYFCTGVKEVKGLGQFFNMKTIQGLARYFLMNKEFAQAQQEINLNGLHYPPAKILDMYFWQVGYDKDLMGTVPVKEEPAPLRNEIHTSDDPTIENGKQTKTSMAVEYVDGQIAQAKARGEAYIDLLSLSISKAIGLNNRFPTITAAMMKVKRADDIILQSSPSGKSSTGKIRYFTKGRLAP